jgi:predicted dehydrogenase
MIRIGVIGYGYWGPNIVRNFHAHDCSEVVLVCDKNPKCQERLRKAHPGIAYTTDEKEILNSPNIDAVAVVTPVWTHYELAKRALENGKHVFVEKPFTWSVAQAEELIELADRKNLKIMVDHTFLFTGAVKKIKDVVEKRELGDLYYYAYSSTTLMSSGISLRMIFRLWIMSSRRSRKQWWPLAKST